MAIIIDCSPLKEFVLETIRDYFSYIKDYGKNKKNLIEKLQDLICKKQDITTRVKEGKEKAEKITEEARLWFRKVSRIIKVEDLKMLMVREDDIAEKVVKLLEEEDLKKLLKTNGEIQGAVINVMTKNMVKENDDNEDYEIAIKVVKEVMKDVSENFKKLIRNDMKVAKSVTKLLEHEELEKISEDDLQMIDILERAKNELDEIFWNTTDESDVKEMLKPLENITDNKKFLEILPENLKLGAEVINSLIKGSEGLKNKITNIKEDGSHFFAVPFLHYHQRQEISKAAKKMAERIESLIKEIPLGPVTLPIPIQDLMPVSEEIVKGFESRDLFIVKDHW